MFSLKNLSIKKLKNIVHIIFVIIICIYVIVNFGNDKVKDIFSKDLNFNKENKNEIFPFLGDFKVVKIVDGDTVHVRPVVFVDDKTKEKIIRIIAVNTLEKTATNSKEKCFADLATDFTKSNLLNKNVKLFADNTQPALDKYGRTLAYVSIPDYKENEINGDTVTFNDSLMRSGLAKTYKAKPPAINYAKYENIRKESEKNKIGIWDEKLCK